MSQHKLPLTILHITEPFGGGTASVIIHLTKHLSNHQHIVFHGEQRPDASTEQVQKRFPAAVKFEAWKYAQREISPWKDILAFIALWQFIKKTPHDIIHLHASKAGFLGRILAWLWGKKNVVYTSHGAAFVRQDISENKRKQYVWLEKIASKLSGVVVCCSDSELKAYQQYNIPVVCIYNGTDIKPAPKQRNIPNQELRIVTTGRITMPKNPSLFNAIAETFIADKNIQFIWVGDGELRHEITSPNIEITGWKSSSEVEEILLSADLYISTSLWEGLPLSVLEAMNLAMPLLLSNCMGNRDLVSQEQNGYLFDSAQQAIEKINFLKTNRNMLLPLGLQSRLLCEQNFDIKKICLQYQQLYYKIIASE